MARRVSELNPHVAFKSSPLPGDWRVVETINLKSKMFQGRLGEVDHWPGGFGVPVRIV